MKILYLSCHSVLEYDELRILTELDDTLPENEKLNIEVFSLNGAYMNPTQSGDYLRSVIPKGKFYQNLFRIALQCDKDRICPELVDWCDVVLSMHNSSVPGSKHSQAWIANNWALFKEKKKSVIWRSIGQSTLEIEKELMQYRKEGLKIVRYSPIEQVMTDFAGQDAIIRFGKDSEEFSGWTGERKQVITLAQSFKKRGEHLGYSVFEKATEGFTRKVYGTENEDLGEMCGGTRSYGELKQNIRESRVFFYFGTQPAPYTLSFIEAMMTGIPIVAVGPKLRDTGIYKWKHYEIPDIISNGINGYWSDDINELKGYIQLLMDDEETAKRIGEAGRKTAIKLFDTKQIKSEWATFLKTI
jgi:hypothetical protein